MDNNYIQLCAEMAYNDVLIESYFEEDILTEANNINFKDKVKKFFEGIIIFIKNLFNKVITFLKDCVKKIKEKLSKKKDKEAKNESTSLYFNIIGMLLNEEFEYGKDVSKFCQDASEYVNYRYTKLTDSYVELYEDIHKISGKASDEIRRMLHIVGYDSMMKEISHSDKVKIESIISSMERDIKEKQDLFLKDSIEYLPQTSYLEKLENNIGSSSTKDDKSEDKVIEWFLKEVHSQENSVKKALDSINKNYKNLLQLDSENFRRDIKSDFFGYMQKINVAEYGAEIKITKEFASTLSKIEQSYIYIGSYAIKYYV